MSSSLEVFYFGDQSVEAHESLHALLAEAPSSCLLEQFLSTSLSQLQRAATKLPRDERLSIQCGGFEELSTRAQSKVFKSATVSSILSCVAQLGWAILHWEQNPKLWERSSDHTVVGICTGNLAALASSVAQSASDLARIGPEFVLLSLRLGVAASARSTNLERSKNNWSFGVSGVSLTSIEELVNSQTTPSHRRVYISARGPAALSLSGPPSVLEEFLSLEALRTARKVPLPILAAYHAEHLDLPDLEEMLPPSTLWSRRLPEHISQSYLGSTEVGEASSLRDLIYGLLTDIFQVPVALTDLEGRIRNQAGSRQIRITTIGPSRAHTPLVHILEPSERLQFGSGSDTSEGDSKSSQNHTNSIAVVGMAGKFPSAENVDELWEILVKGQDLHRKIPKSRFDVDTHCDPSGKVRNTTLTPYGCFYDGMDLFDLNMFKMSPREAAQTDPMQRLMLITAYLALENAGYSDQGDRSNRPKTGTFYGQGGDDYRQCNSSQDIDTNYITGGIRAFGPGRVSYHFGWEGPSMTVDTACSASAVAIHQACNSLLLGECDAALAGGANFLSCSDMFAGLSRASFLSKTGPCKTLDENADGYCRADAVATVVLKRLSDAVESKDNILGVIRAVDTNHAANAISITHPHADTQSKLFSRVIKSVGLKMDDIDHVEMHGTGTQAGDVAETTSIASLLKRPRPQDHPLYLGAVKPNVGHSEAASGVTSLIKGLMMMRHQLIPQHIGVKTKLNKNLPPLSDLNIQVNQKNVPYLANNRAQKRRMLVNNFNATGGSTAILLEEYSPVKANEKDPRDQHIISVSGASENAVFRSLELLQDKLQKHPETSLAHLSYTLTARRLHHSYRFACVASSIEDLLVKSRSSSSKRGKITKQAGTTPVVFVFTGQASQYTGMGKLLWESCDTFRSHLQASDTLCQNFGFPSFLALIKDDGGETTAPSTVQCQLALVALEVALAYTFQSWGMNPTAVVGHSLGEYSALCVSQVLSLADTFYLVGKRALLMQEKCHPGYSMMAVALSLEETLSLLSVTCGIACVNGPTQTVVSGPSKDIEQLKETLKAKSVKATVLQTEYAFHSAQMDPIIADYEEVVESVAFNKPVIPMASTLLGTVVQDQGSFNASYLLKQTRQPVKFLDALLALEKLDSVGSSAYWMELGPAPNCLPMIASTLGTDRTYMSSALDARKSNWETVGGSMAKYYSCGGNPDWAEYHKEYLGALQLIDLPAYPFDMTSHFIEYEGDWIITKNRLPSPKTSADGVSLRSTTLHSLEKNSIDDGKRTMVFNTNLAREDLRDLLAGHKINGLPVAPASIYADMATTAASLFWEETNAGILSPTMEVSCLEISRRLTLSSVRSEQLVKLIATHDASDKQTLRIRIASGNDEDDYARCTVVFEDKSIWSQSPQTTAYLYESRLDLLDQGLRTGRSQALSMSEFYASIGPCVNYGQQYRNNFEAILDNSGMEASARLTLPATSGEYLNSPIWLDAITQLSAYLCGAQKGFRDGTYACSGWRSLRLLEPLQSGSIYRVHARIQPDHKKPRISGDLQVLDEGNRLVAVFNEIEYKPFNQGHVAGFTPHTNGRHKSLSNDDSQPGTSHFPKPLPTSGPAHPGALPTTLSHLPYDFRSQLPPTPPVPSPNLLDSHKPLSASSINLVQAHATASHPSPPPSPELNFARLLEIIAAEIGVAATAMQDDSLLADLGVDSLLSISITAKMRDYLPEKVEESLLIRCDSVGKLRKWWEEEYGA